MIQRFFDSFVSSYLLGRHTFVHIACMKPLLLVFVLLTIAMTAPAQLSAQPTTAQAAPTDTDGDGLIDAEDKCPTHIGPADRGGCPEDGAEMMSRPLVKQTIPFIAGGTAFSGEAEKRLKKLAQAIRKGGGDVLVVVEGHADAAGATDFNQKLSLARAAAVSDYLMKHGVHKLRITTQGRGSVMPVASNDTPEGRGQNRRVEVRAYASLRQ